MRPAHALSGLLAALPLALAHASLAPSAVSADPWPSISIPPGNAANLAQPAPRPGPGDVSSRAEHLAAALGGGDVERALDFFLPREPFLAVKDMRGAARYFETLVRAYRHDIETYRAELPAGADVRFVRFEPSRHCVWMAVGHEANRLPYWSCYGSRLVVSANGAEHTFRVHVLINWGDQWYVTHLGPIPHAH